MCHEVWDDCNSCGHPYGDHFVNHYGEMGCSGYADEIDYEDAERCRCWGFEPIPEPTLAERVRAKCEAHAARVRRWVRKHLPFAVQVKLGLRKSLFDLEDAASFLPRIWSEELIRPVFVSMVNRSYEGEAKELSESVHIPQIDSLRVSPVQYRAYATEDGDVDGWVRDDAAA
jgi:hypothetical protein